MEYQLIRSARRTVSMEVRGGQLIVRAPQRMSLAEIERFVAAHQRWAENHLAKARAQLPGVMAGQDASGSARPRTPLPAAPAAKLTRSELEELAQQALRVIPERVRYYAPLVGVSYGRITIRNQRTRWGSCSARGNLNFNCLLMLAPREVLDAVVVHELCHRLEMNHSARFYAHVHRVYPEYDRWHAWLKQYGAALQARM